MGLIHHAPSGWCPAGGELGRFTGRRRLLNSGWSERGSADGASDGQAPPPPGDRRKKRCKSGRVRQPDQGRFFYSPGVTEPATIGPHDASPHAGQVVRRILLRRNIVILLRRNIVIDAETATSAPRPRSSSSPPSRPRSRRVRLPGRRAGPGVFPRPIASRCSDKGSCPDRKARQPGSLLRIGHYGVAGAHGSGPHLRISRGAGTIWPELNAKGPHGINLFLQDLIQGRGTGHWRPVAVGRRDLLTRSPRLRRWDLSGLVRRPRLDPYEVTGPVRWRPGCRCR
jgi:hypothetical protein